MNNLDNLISGITQMSLVTENPVDIPQQIPKKTKRQLAREAKKAAKEAAKKADEDQTEAYHKEMGSEPSNPKSRWQARRVVCTHFESDEDRKHWDPRSKTFDGTLIRFIVAQKERAPKTGKIHWQIYAQFICQITSRKMAQKLLQIGKSFCTRAVASPAANIEYCTKDEQSCLAHDEKHGSSWSKKGWRMDNTDVFEFGKPSLALENGEGSQRWDLNALVTKIDNGCSLYDIQTQHPKIYCRNRNGIKDIFNAKRSRTIPHKRKMKVTAFWGLPGQGKDNSALKYAIDKYGPHGYYEPTITESGKMWFNKYEYQPCLFIKEFYGQVRFNQMQKILDVYKLEIESKGDTMYAAWTEVIISSNAHCKHWYNGYRNIPKAVALSFVRRVDECIYVEREDGVRPNLDLTIDEAWSDPKHNQIALTTQCGKRKRLTEEDAEYEPARKRMKLQNAGEDARLKTKNGDEEPGFEADLKKRHAYHHRFQDY